MNRKTGHRSWRWAFIAYVIGLTGACAPIALAQSAGTIRVILGPSEAIAGGKRFCEKMDLPDMFTRAIRLRSSGNVVLSAPNAPRNYLLYGKSLDSLVRDCSHPALTSADDQRPESFANQQWIAALYAVRDTVVALVHNEYHDPFAPNCRLRHTDPSNPCWYNSIVAVFSTDGARHFAVKPHSDHVVAAPPIRWTADSAPTRSRAPTPYGYFAPSNLVSGPDGYVYSVFMAIESPIDQRIRGLCVMRTRSPLNPESWRAWDGHAFALRMGSPYGTQTPVRWCTTVSSDVIRDLHGSLSYNTYLRRYVLVGSWADVTAGTPPICGTFLSTSADLVSWSKPLLLMRGRLAYPPCGRAGDRKGVDTYPSLIDPKDSTTNFERTGQSPYLYFVHVNSELDRVLMRAKLRFERP